MCELTTTNGPNPIRELFKYRALNEYTLAFLSTGAIYFSSPAEFNDPFDTRFVERDLTPQQHQFERERRVLVRESFLAENPAQLAPDAIIGLVFGMKIQKIDVLRVRAALDCTVRTRPVAYSRMVECPDGFGLDRIQIPDIDEFIRSL